jgi:plastocyanin
MAVACVAAASTTAPGAALARTKTVYAGGPVGFQTRLAHTTAGGVNSFLQSRITINQGDTVKWDGRSLDGGFHTIDLPGPNTGDLPTILADPAHPVVGVSDAAASPFWFNGQPTLGFNPALAAPSGGHTYDGSARIDSGLPNGNTPFSVTFTKPGLYHYFCDVHDGMEGTVVVLATGKPVPSAQEDAASRGQQEQKDTKIASRLDGTKAKGNHVSVGAAGADGVEVFAMFPATLHIKAGAVVTFSISGKTREAHSATFGDTSKGGYVTELAGAFGRPTIDPRAGYPSGPPARPIQLSRSSHGNGFANTGILDRDAGTPLPPSAKIQFTHAGTYDYVCLIHPFMHGTVIVK